MNPSHELARELYKARPMAFDTAWITLIDDAPIPKVHQSSRFGGTAHNARNRQSRATQSVSSPLPRVRQPDYSCYSTLIGSEHGARSGEIDRGLARTNSENCVYTNDAAPAPERPRI